MSDAPDAANQAVQNGTENGGALRLDKWLWYARFFKSRSLAARLCAGQHVRLNRRRVSKPHTPVRVGDTLTFPQGRTIRVVRVAALGVRRGPAREAALLYEDLSPAATDGGATRPTTAAQRAPGAGRPTKVERRAMERLKGHS